MLDQSVSHSSRRLRCQADTSGGECYTLHFTGPLDSSSRRVAQLISCLVSRTFPAISCLSLATVLQSTFPKLQIYIPPLALKTLFISLRLFLDQMRFLRMISTVASQLLITGHLSICPMPLLSQYLTRLGSSGMKNLWSRHLFIAVFDFVCLNIQQFY